MTHYDKIKDRLNLEDKKEVRQQLIKIYESRDDLKQKVIQLIDGINSCDCYYRWVESIEFLKKYAL